MKASLENAQVNIQLVIDGQVYLVGMDKENLEAVNMLVKIAADIAAPTGKSQAELLEFLNYSPKGALQ